MVAEYAGGVLLRYSSKYALRLVDQDADGDGVEDSKSQVASGSAATAEPDASPSSSPAPTPGASDQPEASTEPTESDEPEPTEEPTVSLNDLYGIKGLDFSYRSSEFTNRYPKDSDAVEIQPEDGQILYVVSFRVKNTSKKSIKVNLTERPFHYELDLGGETVLPSISLLPNGGLNYLMTTIKPGKTEEAVLIFNLDKSNKGSKNNKLTITEGDKSTVVNL
ncbi:MAG: hypothetical protein VZQ83_01125 [Eubacterium sp.]|nr:hypothetical protein [Eubacterium sp.]